ncbi:MAG TPA: hypothetical protein DGG95_17235 [Cytophagales bacterium]|jgi:hypothetical protein|nr:hypothetical protein [Cytophagales bacterium]
MKEWKIEKIFKIRNLPANTLITDGMMLFDYYDSYMIKRKTDDSIETIVEKILALPCWIKIALQIRYFLIVKPFGLTTGRFDNTNESSEMNSEPVPIIKKNKNEIVMGSDDKHFYYRISVMKKEVGQESEIYLNTVVKFNNVWGKIYFLPVKMGHKLVVKSLLKMLISKS